jgi:predicted ferric reductase
MNNDPAKLRVFLAVEVAIFALASLVHRGVLVSGYEHSKAAVAEAVIAAVLLAGLLLSLMRPWSIRAYALLVQGFALLGTLTGVVMIAIGVGPRTAPDLALHALMLVTLGFGLVVARHAPEPTAI